MQCDKLRNCSLSPNDKLGRQQWLCKTSINTKYKLEARIKKFRLAGGENASVEPLIKQELLCGHGPEEGQ